MRTALIFLASLITTAALAEPISVQRFETSDPDVWEHVRRDSDSLPMSLEDLEKLAKAGFKDKALIEMMRTRKVFALADVDSMLRLKKAGGSDAVVQAFSAYAVKPNDRFFLRVNLDVTSASGIGKLPYLYIEVIDPKTKRQEAFFYADLRGTMSKGGRVKVHRDRSDPTLPMNVASVDFSGPVRTRHYGKLKVRVAVSHRPGLQSLENLRASVAVVKDFEIDYPAVSLDRRCELKMRVARDPSIPDFYSISRADLDCHWD